jgi:putative aldouronate transport system substrate-binding protein
MNCKTRKATALFLIFLMLLLAGCSGTSDSKDVKSKKNDAEKTEAQDGSSGGISMDADGKYTEPVELTFSKIMYPDVTLPEGQSPEENAVFDYLKDKYNIEMKMAWQSIGSEYNNKLSVNIASGTVPDIFVCNNYLTFLQLAENDMLADLTEIYEANASDTMKAIDQSFGGRTLDAVTIDGKLLGIPSGNLGYGQDLLWLRNNSNDMSLSDGFNLFLILFLHAADARELGGESFASPLVRHKFAI